MALHQMKTTEPGIRTVVLTTAQVVDHISERSANFLQWTRLKTGTMRHDQGTGRGGGKRYREGRGILQC